MLARRIAKLICSQFLNLISIIQARKVVSQKSVLEKVSDNFKIILPKTGISSLIDKRSLFIASLLNLDLSTTSPEEILEHIEEKRTLLNNTLRRNANYVGHIPRKYCILLDAIEGQITEVKGVGRKRTSS